MLTTSYCEEVRTKDHLDTNGRLWVIHLMIRENIYYSNHVSHHLLFLRKEKKAMLYTQG